MKLSKNVLLGRQAFVASAAASPRDAVAALFALVWPEKLSGDLALLFGAGIVKVLLLAKSAAITRDLAQAVQARNTKLFKSVAARAAVVAVLGAGTSALAQWAEQNLAVAWREKLLLELHARYYSMQAFYTLQNLQGRAAILDPEERLAREVGSSTRRLAKIISLLARAMPSFVFFTFRLARSKGYKYALLPLLYYALGYEVAQRLFPKNLGELYRAQAAQTASFSRSVARVMTHGESIAALGGAAVEEQLVQQRFSGVSGAQEAVNRATSSFGLTFKLAYLYVPRALMSALILSPLLSSAPVVGDVASVVGEFRETGVLLLEMLVANGDVLTISAQQQHMQGTAYRVLSLYETLGRLSEAAKKRETATFEASEDIVFDKVQVATPTGVVLVQDLSFRVPKGGNLLLTGRNGAGKSSIFRALGGLWSSTGTIRKPLDGVVYLPQKPYLPLGDLATLITYPNPAASLSDEDLSALLLEVDLGHLLARRNELSWEGLSLGEQQRLSIARLLYHRPAFAILDECTSSCSVQVEEMLYRKCRELGIAFVTICHRPALKEFHDAQLNLTGDGGYEVAALEHEASARPARRDDRSMHTVSFVGTREEQWAAFRSEPYKGLKAVSATPSRSLMGQLGRLFAIVVPESKAKLVLFSAAIAARTALGFAFGRVSGQLLQAALQRDGAAFAAALARHMALDVAAGVVDEATTLVQNQVAVGWARSLTNRLVRVYFRDHFFYNGKHMDRRIRDADARVLEAQDLASALSACFAGSVAPLVDMTVFGVALYRELGAGGLKPLLAYAAVAAGVLALASPNHKQLNTKEKELESTYRMLQTRIKANAESVAFLAGGKVEEKAANHAVAQLTTHLLRMNRAQSFFKWVLFSVYQDMDSYSSIVTVPKLLTGLLQLQHLASVGDAVAASRNQFLSAATERVLSSAGKLSGLAESVSSLLSSSQRIIELLDVADQMHRTGRFAPTSISRDSEAIEMRHVDIVTPDGCCLMKDLSVSIAPTESLFVTGVNGSGNWLSSKLDRVSYLFFFF